jgi:hypothetical protein
LASQGTWLPSLRIPISGPNQLEDAQLAVRWLRANAGNML